MRCEVAATLTLRCQRCLGALCHQVDTSALLALVSGIDEERLLPAGFDPLPVGEESIRPRDLIEDELLLALPQIPMHAPHACATGIPDVESAISRAARASPFGALAELKRKP